MHPEISKVNKQDNQVNMALTSRPMSPKYNAIIRELDTLRDLKECWDVDKMAPKPSEIAFDRAKSFVDHIDNDLLSDVEIVPDVMGGIAIYLYNKEKWAWISCMNNNNNSFLIANGRIVVTSNHLPANDDTHIQMIKSFLLG
jgi:hypothetical protein